MFGEVEYVIVIQTINQECVIPYDKCNNIIVNYCKGKRAASEKGNNRGINLLDQIRKVTDRVIEKLIRN